MDKKVNLFNIFLMEGFPIGKSQEEDPVWSVGPRILLEGRNESNHKWYWFKQWNNEIVFQNSANDLEAGYESAANNIWFYGCQETGNKIPPGIISAPPMSEGFERYIGKENLSRRNFGVVCDPKESTYFSIGRADLSRVAFYLSKVHGTQFKFNITI